MKLYTGGCDRGNPPRAACGTPDSAGHLVAGRVGDILQNLTAKVLLGGNLKVFSQNPLGLAGKVSREVDLQRFMSSLRSH